MYDLQPSLSTDPSNHFWTPACMFRGTIYEGITPCTYKVTDFFKCVLIGVHPKIVLVLSWILSDPPEILKRDGFFGDPTLVGGYWGFILTFVPVGEQMFMRKCYPKFGWINAPFYRYNLTSIVVHRFLRSLGFQTTIVLGAVIPRRK